MKYLLSFITILLISGISSSVFADPIPTKTLEKPLDDIRPFVNWNSSTILTMSPSDGVSWPLFEPITFTIHETNDGDSPLTDVSVSTSECSEATLVDDGNGDSILDPGETWIYECERTFYFPGEFVVTAIGTGTDPDGFEITPPYDPDETASTIVHGGCLIATAAYGTELAPQIQLLREVRDNTVLSTTSGAAFMTGFNTLYYSFAPTVADWERENPVFKESVRAFITPMISTLSIMTLADDGSEVEVLGLGIFVIALNLAMYIAAPALIGFKIHKHFKSAK